MHVQPEAAVVKIGNRPLWAPGAPQAIEDFIAARGANVRILEFGSGASTIFLLRRGATVVTVEHHEGWAEALQRTAQARGIAGKLTILRRDRPYYDVPAELAPEERFDILLVDGRERVDCLARALSLVKPDGLVLFDDSQRARYWPAFALLADRPCTTYPSAARDTTIWSLAGGEIEGFVRKSFANGEPSGEITRTATLVPREFLDGRPLEADYVSKVAIANLDPVETSLRRLDLIASHATYVSPNYFELEHSSLRLDAGHRFLDHGGAVYRAKSGDFAHAKEVPAFEGVIHLGGRTLDLTASGAGRYAFFLLESLPKLQALRSTGQTLKDFDKILVNSGASWVRDILAPVLSEHREKVVFFSSASPSFRMERSVHIEGIRSTRFTPAWIHAYLDRVFRREERDGAEADSFGPYVYISRQRAEGRRILNHDAFIDLITPLGFKEVFAEDYSPVELARRLRDTQVLISPHGAGLANTILCPTSTKVVELFSSHFTPQYFYLTRDRRQGYLAMPCFDAEGRNVFDRYDAQTRNKAEFNREDIVVPIEDLRIKLMEVCRSSDQAG